MAALHTEPVNITLEDVTWRIYRDEADLQQIIKMMTRDLSEPYPIYTYRYFVHQWPHLTLIAEHDGKTIGTIVSKLD